jgi:very-short-patch-repair endonuclease
LPGEGVPVRTLKFTKQLRKTMTDAETRLWHELRAKRFENYKFKRQAPVEKYIADFACFDHKLIVEIDGSQHEESAADVVRGQWLSTQGFRVLRLWNREVLLDTSGALLSILAALGEGKHHDP